MKDENEKTIVAIHGNQKLFGKKFESPIDRRWIYSNLISLLFENLIDVKSKFESDLISFQTFSKKNEELIDLISAMNTLSSEDR